MGPQIPTNFSNIDNLTLNSNVGNVNVPPGAYGKFTANSSTSFTFGVQGSSTPSTYSLSGLTLNSNSSLQIAGPVILNLGSTLTMNGSAGTSTNPLNLTINIASGGVTLNGGVSLYALVQAPAGQVTINGNSLLQGSVACNGLTINGNGVLSGVPGALQAISPTAGVEGQTVNVSLQGDNTHWVNGQTVASFGNSISVGGASPGAAGPITVTSATTATASIVISPTAALAPRTVTITTPVAGFAQGELETLINSFTVGAVTAPGAASSTVSTIAGIGGTAGFADGAGSSSEFNGLAGLAVGPDGSIYVADAGNNRIRKVQNVSGTWTVSTLAGTGTAGFADGASTSAQFSNPQGVAVDSSGNVYVADTGNNRIREISNGTVSTLGGNGTAGLANGAASSSEFNAPQGVAVDSQGNLYIADTGNSTVRFISTSGVVSSVAGDGTIGSNDSPDAHFNGLIGIGFDGTTAYVYIADTQNERIRRLDPSGNVITLTGSTQGYADGSATTAQFAEPGGIAVDGAGKIIIADTTNSLIREVDPTQVASGSSSAVYTLAGTGARALADGAGNLATFFTPSGVGVGPSSTIYVADTGNQVIRQILVPPIIDSFSPTSGGAGTVVTINGERFDGTSAQNNTVTFAQTGGGVVQAQVTSATRSQLVVTVPTGAVTGPIAVTTLGGTGTSSTPFQVASAPVITDFNPKSGDVGTNVVITGTNLQSPSGATIVTFAGSNGTLQAFVSSTSPTEVNVTVPNGAVTGFITLTTPQGSATTASVFTVVPTVDYQITLSPATATVVQGGLATFVVSVTSPAVTFTQLVSLASSGLSNGVNASFNPEQITAGATSTLTVDLSQSTVGAGSYNFTVSGSGLVSGALRGHAASASLNVIPTGQTTLSGRVLSTDDVPLLGATLSLDGQSATTDSAGNFLLSGINAGTNRPVQIDGTTVSVPNVTYPVITEPATVVAGQSNQMPFVFYLPAIDTQYQVPVVPNQTTVVTTPRVPGLTVSIPAGANLINRNGTPVTNVSITPVPIDRTPTPLPPNVGASLVYTIQPGGATSSLPVTVVFPNLGGANPGIQVNLYDFNHDTVQWEIYGTGHVSADGRTVSPDTNPATGQPYGLMGFSWYFIGSIGGPGSGAAPGGNPGGSSGSPCGSSKHPVDLSSGVKLQKTTDIVFGGARGGLALARVYTSDLTRMQIVGRFGLGAKDNYDFELSGSFGPGGSGRVIFPEEATGQLYSYSGTEADGTLDFTTTARADRLGDVLRQLTSGAFQYRYANGTLLQFDASPRLTAIVDTNGNATTLSYDPSSGLLSQITDPTGRSITLVGNGITNSLVGEAIDPLGNKWTYNYGVFLGPGQQAISVLNNVKDPLNNETAYLYDTTTAQMVSIFDARGTLTEQISYDTNGRVVQELFADNSTENFTYGLSGGVVTNTTDTDPMGRTQTKRFNAAGYVIASTDALGQPSIMQRDVTKNLLLSASGPCGCTQTTNTYDSSGNLLTATDALGQTESFQYDPVFNQVTQYTDKLGRVAAFAHDSNGNLTSVTQAQGVLNLTTTFGRDTSGELTSVTDPLGNTSTLQYDPSGNLASKTDALGDVTTYQHDAIGRLTSIADPLGRTVTLTYDADHLISVTDRAGTTTQFTYDQNGNMVGVTAPNGLNQLPNQWTYTYDAKNRLTVAQDPFLRKFTRAYDVDDELISAASASGRVIQYGYDQRGKVNSVTDPMGGVAAFTFDSFDHMVGATDQRQNTTSFTYDAIFRVLSTTGADGSASNVSYDAVGNATTLTDGLGRQIARVYDAINRVTQTTYSDAVVSYSYDAGSRPVQVSDSESGSINWTYDAANRLLSEETAAGLVSYAHNAAGQRTSMTAGSLPPTTYGYDSAGRPQTISQSGNTFTYSYDILSRRVGLQRPNGVNTTYTRDAMGRLTGLQHSGSQGGTIENLSYSYDLDDEPTSIVSLSDTPTAPASATFGSADSDNRVSSVGNVTTQFDGLGETTSKTSTSGGSSSVYQWDGRGRLVQATTQSNQTVSYRYDPLGRRIASTAGGVTTNFLYDGQDVVLDEGSDGSSTSYINGSTVDEKLEQSGAAGSLYFLQDRVGSTFALTDGSGNVAETESYDPFGHTAGSAFTRYGFTGRELDSQTGLMLYRARWYDPSQGRFISEDPSGHGHSLNLYAYVGSNPLSWVDPSGLGPDSPWWDPWDWFSGPRATRALGEVGSFFAGFGDTITAGGTAKVRQWTGADSAVDPCSGSYTAGHWGGRAWQAAFVVNGAVSVASTLSTLAESARLAQLAEEAEILQSEAQAIHGVLDPIAQSMRTTAVLATEDGTVLAGVGGAPTLTTEQIAVAESFGIDTASQVLEHGEMSSLFTALWEGELPEALGTTRVICTDCQAAIEALGGILTSDFTAIWP